MTRTAPDKDRAGRRPSSTTMGISTHAARRFYFLAFVCLVLFLAAAVHYVASWSTSGAVPHERYYRAVFVLQSLGGPAAREPEDIPRRVINTDATESLLHHPDKIFVLAHVAEELAKARGDVPKAALFEACARLGLGERREAARLLADYVVESGYDAGHYALLCEVLDELGDYSSLLMISREWRGRDPSCRADRSRLTWAALHNLGRYYQASAYALSREECLGWQAGVYAAKSLLAASGESEAEPVIEAALRLHPQDADRILLLWSQIKNKERM